MISSEEILESGLAHRSFTDAPELATHSEGNYIYLQDGRKIIDGSGGAAVVSVGHGNKEVISSVADQLSKVSYVSSSHYTTDAAESLANLLLEGYQDKISKVWFANSGSEANEAAIKLAIQYYHVQGKNSKTHFISRKQSYHGNCIGGVSLSGHPARRAPYEEFLPQENFHHLTPAYEYRYKKENETTEQFVKRLSEEFENKVLEVGPDKIAAYVLETVVGATTGCVTAPPGYFREIRKICDKYDILMFLDEIMCGSGRTGTIFAWEQEEVVPDITTSGKTLSGGYSPLSAVFFNEKITQALKKTGSSLVSGQTYQAYPLSCAAGLAVRKIIKRDNLLANVVEMGEYLSTLLNDKLQDFKIVGNIRGRGLFWGIELVTDKETKLPFKRNLGNEVTDKIFDKGVAVYPGHGTFDGYEGDHIIISPAYNVTRDVIDEIVKAVVEVLEEYN